jgi:hypothetical protein
MLQKEWVGMRSPDELGDRIPTKIKVDNILSIGSKQGAFS